MQRTIELEGKRWAIEERARFGATTVRADDLGPARYVSILTCTSDRGDVVSTAAPAELWPTMPDAELAHRIQTALGLRRETRDPVHRPTQ